MRKTAIASAVLLLPLAVAACGTGGEGGREYRAGRLCTSYMKGTPAYDDCVEKQLEQRDELRSKSGLF